MNKKHYDYKPNIGDLISFLFRGELEYGIIFEIYDASRDDDPNRELYVDFTIMTGIEKIRIPFYAAMLVQDMEK